jgi:hypothetical protein
MAKDMKYLHPGVSMWLSPMMPFFLDTTKEPEPLNILFFYLCRCDNFVQWINDGQSQFYCFFATANLTFFQWRFVSTEEWHQEVRNLKSSKEQRPKIAFSFYMSRSFTCSRYVRYDFTTFWNNNARAGWKFFITLWSQPRLGFGVCPRIQIINFIIIRTVHTTESLDVLFELGL